LFKADIVKGEATAGVYEKCYSKSVDAK